MLTCFSVSNSIGLTATPLYTIEHSGRANNSIVNAVDSMEFYMAGSTSGLGRALSRRKHVSESHTCHQYGLLDKGKSSISPIESGGSHTTRGHHLWLLGQGKVARFSGGRRWLVCHQQSPFTHYTKCTV